MGPKQTRYVARVTLERNSRELLQAMDDLPYPKNDEHKALDVSCRALLQEALDNNNALLAKLKQLDS